MVDPITATQILAFVGTTSADFHTLSTDQVDKLVEYAVSTGYRKPKNASGSRARYFYAYLQRKAEIYRKMIAVADAQDKKRRKLK